MLQGSPLTECNLKHPIISPHPRPQLGAVERWPGPRRLHGGYSTRPVPIDPTEHGSRANRTVTGESLIGRRGGWGGKNGAPSIAGEFPHVRFA